MLVKWQIKRPRRRKQSTEAGTDSGTEDKIQGNIVKIK